MERGAVGAEVWTAVDDYLESHMLAGDSGPGEALAAQRAAGLPDIAVSPTQGKLLEVLARSIGATRAVEFGTLGGYSTVWIARALGDGGRVVTFELSQAHADVARANFEAAGVSDRVEIRVGPALDNLHTLAGDAPFDLAFIDADKANNLAYFEAALTRMRPGALMIVDNVVREGDIVNPALTDASTAGSRLVIEAVAANPAVEATVVQTVGRKKHDGLLIATVL